MHKRKIRVGDVVFESIAAAARSLNVCPLAFRNWLKSNNPKWAHIQYEAQEKVSKITRTGKVRVCYRGRLYDSLQAAARQNDLTAPAIAHIVNSELHPDSYYLKEDGTRIKHTEKPRQQIAAVTQRRRQAARNRLAWKQEMQTFP